MVRVLSFALAYCSFAFGIAGAFERPIVFLGSPASLQEDGTPSQYARSTNMLVSGSVKPVVGEAIRVRIYHVYGDGSVRLLMGASTPIRDGQFVINFDAPGDGWEPGRLRVEVSLMGMPQVKSAAEVIVVARGRREGGGIRLPEDSGIALDLEKSRGTTIPIVPHKLFLIRGQFEREGIESKLEGPPVGVSLALEPVGDKKGIQYGSFGSVSLRKTEGKPTFEYEVQVLAPRRPGIYSVRVRPHFVKGLPEKPNFMLDVAEHVK